MSAQTYLASDQQTRTITETEEARRGALIADVLNLRRDREHHDRWQTSWGTKTDLGLFRIMERIVKDGE